ncbi:2-hydroxycyclohexane-1-carbonyl-CoA dehydrogenase [Actinomadura sp. NBRC 104412]|uniref:SDR family NAD(P)-dependent oxidoreductase n=1 Tax=Actinomadura sp. NBRC 104412 TaxID=3032203 RepID=UPI0024A01234|nr:SDR family NAD(P)-dependent oxidoreductase [Actinomadura sp. NBRC 104412]GLZ06183.1 2-hydroxycyclohexane-1-carbonyl-CoA dehydrogenase [Actinomadura sp. NBRC 104412]
MLTGIVIGEESEERPRPILVTGAASGIGRCAAEVLAARGHPVAVTDRDGDGAEKAAAAIRDAGGAAHAFLLDVTDAATIRAAVAEAAARLGGLGGLVNNAGWTLNVPLEDHDDDLVDTLLAINLSGTIKVTREVVPVLREWGDGRIVNVASDSARTGMSNGAAYTAAKGGVLALTRSLARELARDEITVNAVSPGIVDTPLLADSMRQAPGMLDKLRRGIPMRRLGTPADVASAIAYFCGPGAGYVTGQTLSVSGGMVIV